MKSDKVAGAISVTEADEIMMFTKKGQAVRSPINTVRVTGRAASGVKLINLAAKDELIGISKVIATEENQSGDEEEGAEGEVIDVEVTDVEVTDVEVTDVETSEE
jgi:DNA gyrase subunit A